MRFNNSRTLSFSNIANVFFYLLHKISIFLIISTSFTNYINFATKQRLQFKFHSRTSQNISISLIYYVNITIVLMLITSDRTEYAHPLHTIIHSLFSKITAN